MSNFRDPKDEERLCQVLKAYVEEWGAEYVVVSVPKEWRQYSTGALGLVRLEFTIERSICISVHYEFVRIDYFVQLRSA